LKQITALLKVYSEDGETARASAQAACGTLQALEGCPQVSEVFSRQAGPAKIQLNSFLVFLPVGCVYTVKKVIDFPIPLAGMGGRTGEFG
jgi:hypothetical protein